jgi:hypothetical protein
MAMRRKYILVVLSVSSVLLIIYGFSRWVSAPVSIALFTKPARDDRQVIFIITNSLPKDLRWISIVEVGGPTNWHPAAKQPNAPNVNATGLRTLPAQSAYWLPVSVPEEGGTWRVRCVMTRPETALEKKFAALFTKLRMSSGSWTVEGPSLTESPP